MSYKLKFLPIALKEWKKLGKTISSQFKKKLEERLQNPHVPSAKLSGCNNVYKIKLRSAGCRLVYQVNDSEIIVTVIAVGKREGDTVYRSMDNRL